MAGPPPSLQDSFTEQGFWWLAGHEAKQVGGTLTFDPADGAVLRLLGLFGDAMTALKQSMSSEEGEGLVTIHGVTTKGKPVTLLNARSTQRQFNMPGIASETWASSLLVIGIHLASTEDAVFSKSYLRFEAIEEWLEHRPFSPTYEVEAKHLTVTAVPPPEAAFASHADFDVSTLGRLRWNGNRSTSFSMDATSHMAITGPEPHTLNWHLDRAVRLQELASLCTGHYLPLTSFELLGPDVSLGGGGTRPAEVHVYAHPIRADVGDRPRHEQPVITGPELIRFNPQAVQLWFDQFESFGPALDLFFTISSQREMFINILLLLAIQALEVFHRRTSRETVMPPEGFESVVKKLVAAIPAGTEQRMREKLESLYCHANEPSLGQRLKSIIASLTDAFGEAPAGFDKAFRHRLVDTRNYYTHFSPELRDRILDGEGMHWASRRVILLLTLLFLQRLGVAASDIAPLLKRHDEFAWLWASANRPW